MARCDQGYLCAVCGEPVKNIIDSSLYVRYVLGEVQVFELFAMPDRHLHCEPALSQYIVHEKFAAPSVTGSGDKRTCDPAQRQEQEERITQAWVRLREVHQLGIPLTEYPLKNA